MPPVKKKDDSSHRQKSIKDFFVIPKSRIPANDVIEDEIVVASTKPTLPSDNSRERSQSQSPAKPKNGNSIRSPKPSQTSSALSSLRSTPTKQSTPVTLRQKKAAIVSLQDAREDTPVLSTSSQSSQWRVLSAVEVPSSSPTVKQTSPPSPTPPPPAPAMDSKPHINQPDPKRSTATFTTSFSSISTLSSIPTSTASSSRRIIKNGLQAITNSDSGSADASSDEELADISTFIPRKRVKLTPSPPNEREDKIEGTTSKTGTRQSVRLSVDGGKRGSTGSLGRSRREESSPPPKKAVYKHSLVKMVAQKEREMKAAARLEEMDAAFAEGERKREEERRKDRVAMGTLKDVVADDSDEGERMMLAIQRTEMMEGEEEVYFFAGMRQGDGVSSKHANFPIDNLSSEKAWVRQLADEEWRTQACLTGFVRERAERDGLPLPVEVWMTNQVLLEKRDDLREAYVAILEVCPKQKDESGEHTYLLQDFFDLRLSPAERLKPIPAAGPPQRLSQVLRTLQHICPRMLDFSLAHTLHGLIMTNTDANVQKDAASKRAMETCIESILAQIPPDELENISSLVVEKMSTDPWPLKIKCRSVSSMPAFSIRSHALRRRLALFLILQQLPVALPLISYSHGQKILARLKDAPVFSISDATDYALLNALIQVLDIAIDAGFYPSTDSATHAPPHPAAKSEFAPKVEAEKTFNAQIDAFVAQLTLMASRIRDAGTAHLRRTQAKIALERLCRRLEYGVRIGVKRRKGVFGGDEGGAVGMLRGWLAEGEKLGDVDAVG